MRSPGATSDRLRTNDAAWDAFVAGVPRATHLQTTAWAETKRANGWRSRRLVVETPDGPVGAQLLLRRARPLPWTFGYAPRGPVASAELDRGAVVAFTERLRAGARPRRISHVRIEPEAEEGSPLGGWLAETGWRPADDVQPVATRVIDLRLSEDELWSGLRKKTRNSVNRARRAGIRVVEGGDERLGDFFRIHTETARRVGIPYRTEESYRRIWEAFGPRGMARFVIGETAEGEPVATSFLVTCGTRVFSLYGGMTSRGAELYANHLVKWEAIVHCRASGFTEYDMWGLPNPSIAWFKAGFGGREVRYIGAWDLVLNPLVRRGMLAAQRVRVLVARRSQGVGTPTADA